MELKQEYRGMEFAQAQESGLVEIRLFGEGAQDFTSVLTPEAMVQTWEAETQGSGFERSIASIELEISI